MAQQIRSWHDACGTSSKGTSDIVPTVILGRVNEFLNTAFEENHLAEWTYKSQRCLEPHQNQPRFTTASHRDTECDSYGESCPTEDSDNTSFLLPLFRQRVHTMPSPSRCNVSLPMNCTASQDSSAYRVRSYSVSGKRITNCGDVIRIRRHPSNASVSSTSSGYETRDRTWSRSSQASTLNSSTSDFLTLDSPQYLVTMLGMDDVGKSAIVNQFISSEQTLEQDDGTEICQEKKSVSVALGGEETELTFLDHSALEKTSEELIRDFDVDAYIVVYSVTDRESFGVADTILGYLRECDLLTDKAVILVGNKTDLARLRTITSEDGKTLAKSYGCKFIETSAWLSHNVDELLVGVISQIRLRLERLERHERKEKKQERHHHRYRGSKTSLFRSRSLVRDIFRKIYSKSKSCDNLLVL